MVFIGIDPGKSGAMAIIDGQNVKLVPFDEYEYISALTSYDPHQCFCILERVGAMPKQGVTSSFNFGANYGWIQGMLWTLGIPFELVTPQKWKKEFGVTSDKNTSIAVAHRLFPNMDFRRTPRSRTDDDGIAEALLMAVSAMRKGERK